jgi:uncharacterized membrane protein
MIISSGVTALIIAVFSGCGDKADPIRSGEDPGMRVTYTNKIKAILDNNCILCHDSEKQGAERNGAPLDVNLDTYENVIDVAERANTQIQAGNMPPTGGLPDNLRDLFQQWIDQGREE